MKPNLDMKPVNQPNQNKTQETKPMQRTIQKLMNTTPKPDTKKKPNQEPTTKTKPAQTSKLARKVKTPVLPKSDLKLFLEKKKQERELK